jgi:hypothetical protein
MFSAIFLVGKSLASWPRDLRFPRLSVQTGQNIKDENNYWDYNIKLNTYQKARSSHKKR